MTQPTRIYKHSSAGTDWAAILREAFEDVGGPKNRFHDEAFAFHKE
jgi:hypothetical protein